MKNLLSIVLLLLTLTRGAWADVVGPLRLVVPTGYTLFANPFDVGEGELRNTLDTLFGRNSGSDFAPLQVSKFDNAAQAWVTSGYDPTVGSWFPNLTLNPGEGALLFNPGVAILLELSGTPRTAVVPVPASGAPRLLSRQILPRSDLLSDSGVSQIPDGTLLYLMRSGSFEAYLYNLEAGGVWEPSTPEARVGEAFWLGGLPSIQLQVEGPTPVDPVRYVGQMLELSVRVVAGPLAQFRLQWFRNGSPIPGANAEQLRFGPLDLSNTGDQFHVVAQHELGTARSQTVTLRVLEPFKVIEAPVSQTVVEGAAAKFCFQVASLDGGVLSYQWLRVGSGALLNATNPCLSFASTTSKDAGEYQALVVHPASGLTLASEVVTLGVLPRLEIVRQPVSQQVAQGNPAVFCVEVRGTPPFQYQWLRNKERLEGAKEACLRLPAVTLADAGEYRVIVMELVSGVSRTSDPAKLDVLVPLRILTQPQSTNVNEGTGVQLCVQATGTPPLRFQWFHDRERIPGGTNACLRLRPARLADAGEYRVQVTDANSAVNSDPAKVEVNRKPVEINPDQPGYVPGDLVLRLVPELAEAITRALQAGVPFGQHPFPEDFRMLNQRYQARGIRRAHPRIERTAQRLEHIFILTLNAQFDMLQAAKDYQSLSTVGFAEPNPIVKASLIPNDPFYSALWGMQSIRADVAWNTATGSGVLVAVIDSGVDYAHCDLQANIWMNPGETGLDGMGNNKATNGIDDDGNGLVDDVRGWDFVDHDNAPMDGNGHGTHVAGTIAAVGNNAEGVIGLAFGARIMVVRGLDNFGFGKFSQLMDGLIYAADNGAKVINNSWGGFLATAWGDAVVDYVHSKGALVVAAAGNDGIRTCETFPANAENSLAVGAVEPGDILAYYSNFGIKTDVFAPGGDAFGPPNDIISVLAPASAAATSGDPTFPGVCGSYLSLAGTSMAAPHVAGLAALVLQLHPTWTSEEVKQVIRQSAVPLGLGGVNGFDSTFAYGRIDAANALAPGTPPPVASLTVPKNCTEVVLGPAAPVVDVFGEAGGLGFTHYDVQLAPGLDPAPATFTTLFSSATPVPGGILMNDLQLQTVAGGVYTLRVVSHNNLGKSSEDRNEVNFRSVYLTLPTPKQYVRESSIPVHGVVPANLQRVVAGMLVPDPLVSFSLSWRTPTGAPQLFHTDTVGASGLLAHLSTSSVPEGDIYLQLSAEYQSGAVYNDEVLVVVDKLIRDGWPVTLNETLTLKSPMIADLDGDGANEVIYGASVFEADGTLRPGWDNSPGLGRSNPAVVDAVNQDGKLEVIAALFTRYVTPDTNAPNCGGPVIHCYPHTGKGSPYWSFAPQNPFGADVCANVGVPSTISAGDLDGDGKLEVVFSVNYLGLSPPQTTVFVLEAATGVLKASRSIVGYSVSSIALANLDAALDAPLELVISRDLSGGPATYVMKYSAGTLVDLPGWPRPGGWDAIDPVVGDVDHDGKYEVLVGNNLWHADGTAFTGWPLPGSTLHRAGALVPLCDPDCELEVVLGTDFDTAIRVVDEDRSPQAEVPITDEDLLTLLVLENPSQGNPIVADLTGDGCMEIIRPSPVGYDNGRPNRVYATTTNHFPRYVCEPRGVVRSSALVDDLDQDGMTDVLIAGGGKLYAWNLKTTFCPRNPWPMFQHDLAHTGTLPITAGTARDLYVEDTPFNWNGNPDGGLEPDANMTGLHMWCSRAIWLRQDCDPVEGNNYKLHQNPEFGQQNCVYVKVCNRGCVAVTNGTVEVYYSKASAGLCWPASWTLAGTVGITNVPAYGWSLAAVPWFPPGLGHYCLLTRIVTPDDPITLTTPACIEDYVRFNNNIAWRNVNVLDLEQATTGSFEFRVHNIALVPKLATLRMTADGNFFGNGGLAEVDLRTLFTRWQTNGFQGANVAPLGGTHVKLLGSPADMAGIYLGPDEERVVQVTITVPHPVPVAGLKAIFNLEVLQIVDAQVVGGVAYEVSTRGEDTDTDGDGIPDVTDPDDDGDGIPDNVDQNPLVSDLPTQNPACVTGRPYIFRGGLRDLGALPSDPGYRGYFLNASFPQARWKEFDGTLASYVSGVTFSGLPSGIAKGELELAARPLRMLAASNSLALGLVPPSTSPSFAWSSLFKQLPGAGGTWGANPLTRFDLDLASLPPNGNLATNLIAKLNADHAFDVYAQRETLLDWLELRLWTCPAATFAHGLPHRALGSASLTNGAASELLLSGLGNSGGDGAYVHLGQAQGWRITPEHMDPAGLPTGSFIQFMTAGAAGGDANRLLGRVRVEDRGSDLAASFDFNTIGASTYTLWVKSNGVALAVVTNRSGVGISWSAAPSLAVSDSGPVLGLAAGDQAAVIRLELSALTGLSVSGAGNWIADEVCAIPELGTNALVIDHRQGVFVTSAHLPTLKLTEEAVEILNHLVTAEGDATLHPSGGFLLVSGLGSSATDGLRASLNNPSASITVAFGELRDQAVSEAWGNVNGSWIETRLMGSRNSTPDQELVRAQVRLANPGGSLPFELGVEATSLGVSSYRAQILSNGVVVATATLGSGAALVDAERPPRSVGHGWGTEEVDLRFAPGTAMNLNGTQVRGDQLLVLPQGMTSTIDSHSVLRVISSGLEEFVVTSLCERLGSNCDPTSLQGVTAGDGNVVLYWEGCGYRLQASDSIEAPVHWIDLASSSPVSLPAAQPYRWFRLVCP